MKKPTWGTWRCRRGRCGRRFHGRQRATGECLDDDPSRPLLTQGRAFAGSASIRALIDEILGGSYLEARFVVPPPMLPLLRSAAAAEVPLRTLFLQSVSPQAVTPLERSPDVGLAYALTFVRAEEVLGGMPLILPRGALPAPLDLLAIFVRGVAETSPAPGARTALLPRPPLHAVWTRTWYAWSCGTDISPGSGGRLSQLA